jgi:hypothetical protein
MQAYLENSTKCLKTKKHSYIKFFSSLEGYVNPDIEDWVKNCITYLDDLGADEIHPYRLTFKIQLLTFYFFEKDMGKLRLGVEKMKELIEFLGSHRDKYDYIQQRLISVYNMHLPFAQNSGDTQSYLKYVEDYINLGIANFENRESIVMHMKQTINCYAQFNQFDKAK